MEKIAPIDRFGADSTPTNLTPALDAVACGSLGCYASDDLYHIDPPGQKPRVLCERHARDYQEGDA